ncbi:AAA domain-containing protein, partial [Russula earlei]
AAAATVDGPTRLTVSRVNSQANSPSLLPSYDLHSIWVWQLFNDVLVRMVDVLRAEPLQESSQDARPATILIVADSLRSALSKSLSENDLTRRRATLHSLDTHLDRFVTVAFSRLYGGPEWATARTSIRALLSQVLKMDCQVISTTITQLSRAVSHRDLDITVPDVRKQRWTTIFTGILPHDSNATLAMISSSNAKSAFNEVNGALALLRTGLSEVISKYANYNSPAATAGLLGQPGAARDVAAIMLCPSEDLRGAAQALVGQAFDADVRLECFHAMFRNLTGDTLEGIFAYLKTFIKHATVVPEACDISKALVRCLTDVIEVLCSSPDSLLLDDEFLRSDNGAFLRLSLPKCWALMTESISVIFRRTPAWSVYFESEDMIRWMRDALIFGRDMLAQWRTFESATNSHTNASPPQKPLGQKLSRIGKKMMDDLQQFLPELTKWLRLTDEELLHQSFALLQSLLDCFKKTGVRPSEIGVQKLTRHIEGSRKKDGKAQTRLDSARILKLEATLAAFEDDSDIEFVSHSLYIKSAHQKLPKEKVPKTDTKAESSSRQPKSRDAKPPAVSQVPSSRSLPRQSNYFTSKDEEKLSKESTMPRFRSIVASSSRHVPSKSSRHTSVEIRPLSSESSSDDGSDQERGLSALGKFQRTPQLKKPAERRQTKMLDLPTLENNSALRRLRGHDDARKRALRMKPDISRLHRVILSWDWGHSGPDPPETDFTAPLVCVPDHFSNYSHYQRVFEPLLLLECWAQILQAKEEEAVMFESKIISRQFVDDFVDFDLAIVEPLTKGWSLMDTDIILLSDPEGKHSVMGKIPNTQFMCQHDATSENEGPSGCRSVLSVGSGKYSGRQLFAFFERTVLIITPSLSTLHREYAALMAMPHYDCADFILNPHLPKPKSVDQKEIQNAMIKYNVNEPQARAIISALRTDGFSLIQGPPGTGKTSTICGLVQAFLSSRPQHIAPNGTRSTDRIPSKILLCAPSNAAIDEIANRLKEGVSGAGRRSVIPKVVRIGTDKAINVSVKEISLDNLVDEKVDSSQSARGGSKESASEIALLRSELESVRQLRQQKQNELAVLHDNAVKVATLDEEIKRLNYRRVSIIQKLDRLRDQQKSDNRTLDAVRRKFRMEVLAEADVICSTLSGSGHDILESLEFDMIIIDEAAQAIELSSLIPLKYNVARCVMVGDPQQLPPTVISQEASKYLYNQSLFVRLQKLDPDAVHLLSIQYRMHPDISQLPSRIFYRGLLKDGLGMAEKTARSWHAINMFGPYRFFNILRGQEASGPSHSLMNRTEVQVAVSLYDRLVQECSSEDFRFRVGVVSMYRAQIVELRRAFEARFGGQEKDIIILSCVRAGPGLQNVGFLSDYRRMNVALTRARASLFVLGHCPTLERSDKTWKEIISDARERDCLIEADVKFFTAPKEKLPLKSCLKPPKKAAPPPQTIPTTLVAARSIGSQGAATSTSLQRPHVSPSESAPTSPPSVLMPARNASSSQSSAKSPDVPLISPKPAAQPSDPKSCYGPCQLQACSLREMPPKPPKPKPPTSIFIPKKRPAPGGGGGGPPNKKRT